MLQSGSLWNEGLLPILSIQAVRCYAEIAALSISQHSLLSRRCITGVLCLGIEGSNLLIVHDVDKHKRDTANSAYTMECYHAVVLQKNVDSSEL